MKIKRRNKCLSFRYETNTGKNRKSHLNSIYYIAIACLFVIAFVDTETYIILHAFYMVADTINFCVQDFSRSRKAHSYVRVCRRNAKHRDFRGISLVRMRRNKTHYGGPFMCRIDYVLRVEKYDKLFETYLGVPV